MSESAVDEYTKDKGYLQRYKNGRCIEKATMVIADDGEEFNPDDYDENDYSATCTTHGRIWLDHLNGTLVEELAPVSQEDVDAAIASILAVAHG